MATKFGNIALALLATGAGIAFLVPKDKDKDKDHELMKLKIRNVQMQDRYLVMNVVVQNHGTHNMKVQRMQGDFFANDKRVAGVNMVGDYLVAPGHEQVIPLIAVPVVPNLLSSLFAMFNKKGLTRVFFTGTITVNTHPIPLTMSYTA